MRKVLVTGASGWIGRHCVRLLASKGYQVHAASRRKPRNPTPPNVTWHEVDLLLPGSAAKLVRHVLPDCALHLAWYAEPGKFWTAPENLDWVRASLEFLKAFAEQGGKRIVSAGSCAEYEGNSGECFENATPLLPGTLYGASKLAVERVLERFGPSANLSYSCGRIFFLYGPHEHPSRLVSYVIRSLLSGERALCSEGAQILDYLHVEDAARAFVKLLETDVQGPVNIGSGAPTSIRDLLLEIGQQIGRPELIQFSARTSDPGMQRLWANTQRLKSGVGWNSRFTLSSGIAQTVEWWRQNITVTARAASEKRFCEP